MRRFAPLGICVACGGGTWEVTTWGGQEIEEGIGSDAFADGCSVVFDGFDVVFASIELLDSAGAVAGRTPGAQVWDLTEAGPRTVARIEVPAAHYGDVRFVIAPSADAELRGIDAYDPAASVAVAGAVRCGEVSVGFDWRFDVDTAYACAPADLTVPSNGTDTTQLTVPGDHLFYDGLLTPDAALRGLALVAADADQSGDVTLEELGAVDIATVGYRVGAHADVTTLREHVTALARTLGHLDGDDPCASDW